jgi:hypothetical protein
VAGGERPCAQMKRLTLAVAVSATVLGVLIWLVVSRGGIRDGFAHSAPLADWLVALGTSGLAVATVLLAREARNEAVAVRRRGGDRGGRGLGVLRQADERESPRARDGRRHGTRLTRTGVRV